MGSTLEIVASSSSQALLGIPLAGLRRKFLITTLMLICAVLASLAFGVLAAYALCVAMFSAFRTHARSATREGTAASSMEVALKG